ncbi:MAG: hypothetical protein H0X66_20880 [Verrucomicrobia bacterium]|nr:hypothetical protein [Verrucomicrobiota bacterium]
MALSFLLVGGTITAADQNSWFKGNLHTHTLWSDGDDFPEMIIEWYKTNNYDFLTLSDHNTIADGIKWVSIDNDGRKAALAKYLSRWGTGWIEQGVTNEVTSVRLKTFEEFAPEFVERGKFLLMRGEEISARYLTAPVHLGAINVRELIEPRGGTSVVEVMQNNIDAVLEQRKRTGQPMFAHINHPNFRWAITAEELMQVRNERFFEVYNAHPHVYNDGDEQHAGTERVWDIILTRRLAELNLPVMYGIATDDSHRYHTIGFGKNNPGEGWIMVQAKELSPKHLIHAMEAGDFYASTGVTLKNVNRGKKTYTIEIDPEPGVEYMTKFIGTRKGYLSSNEPFRAPSGTPLRVTHNYSEDVGQLLAISTGTKAAYQLRGDEIYVRAKVYSTKRRYTEDSSEAKKGTGSVEEFESAWCQPLVTGVK